MVISNKLLVVNSFYLHKEREKSNSGFLLVWALGEMYHPQTFTDFAAGYFFSFWKNCWNECFFFSIWRKSNISWLMVLYMRK